jgi:hypothetical protein
VWSYKREGFIHRTFLFIATPTLQFYLNLILHPLEHLSQSRWYSGQWKTKRTIHKWDRDRSVGLATRYGLDGPWSNPGVPEIFRTLPDQLWSPPSNLYSGYRFSFAGVKRPGRGVNHPPPSYAEVKERIEPYLYSPSGPSWPVLGWPLPLLCVNITLYKAYLYYLTTVHSKLIFKISNKFKLCAKQLKLTHREKSMCEMNVPVLVN